MAGHKERRLPMEQAVEAASAIVRACDGVFEEVVRDRMASGADWHVAAASEYMALLRLLQKERDFPRPDEPLPGTSEQ